MRPEAQVWRKAARRALRGIPRGRYGRRVTTEAPRRGSSWWRRHVQSGLADWCPIHARYDACPPIVIDVPALTAPTDEETTP